MIIARGGTPAVGTARTDLRVGLHHNVDGLRFALIAEQAHFTVNEAHERLDAVEKGLDL